MPPVNPTVPAVPALPSTPNIYSINPVFWRSGLFTHTWKLTPFLVWSSFGSRRPKWRDSDHSQKVMRFFLGTLGETFLHWSLLEPKISVSYDKRAQTLLTKLLGPLSASTHNSRTPVFYLVDYSAPSTSVVLRCSLHPGDWWGHFGEEI